MPSSDSTLIVKVVPEIDEGALLEAVVNALAGHAVVKPGETLVLRVKDWTVDAADAYQEYLYRFRLPFRVLVVVADELAVAPAETHITTEVQVNGGAVMSDEDIAKLAEKIGRLWRGGDGTAPARVRA